MSDTTTTAHEGFEERQARRLQPLLRTGLFIGATLFVAFSLWDGLLGSPALTVHNLPIRLGFSAALAFLGFLTGPGLTPARTVGILHAATVAAATGITLLVARIPESLALAVGSLGLMAIVLGALTTTLRNAIHVSLALVGTANAGMLLNGFPGRDALVVDMFLVPSMIVACVLVQRREASEKEAYLLEQALLVERESLRRLASTDALTGASNRRHFLENARRFVTAASHAGTPLSVLVLDVDHFKRINDTMGHAVGDATLRGLTATCLGALRDGDLFGRLGGEEFAAILPGTDAKGAKILADRLRRHIAETEVVANGMSVRFTASIGVSALAAGDSIEELLNRADGALYEAKRAGRDRVHAA